MVPWLTNSTWRFERGFDHFYPSVTQNSFSVDLQTTDCHLHHVTSFDVSIMSEWDSWAGMVWLSWSHGSPIPREDLKGASSIFTPSWPKTHAPGILAAHWLPSPPCNIYNEWMGQLKSNGLVVMVPWLTNSTWRFGRGFQHFYPSVTQNSCTSDPCSPPIAISTILHHLMYP